MKNISKYMLLVAALGLSACNMDEEDLSYASHSKQDRVEFTASMDGSVSLSKSYLQPSNGRWDVVFHPADSINVFTKNGSASGFGIKELSKDGYTAIFSGDIDNSEGYYAVYPFRNTSISGNVISAVVPKDQSTSLEDGSYSYDRLAAISVAYSNGADRNFMFHNATALIKMGSSLADFNGVTFETVDGTPIAGICAIEVSADGKVSSVSGGTESKLYVSANGRNLVASLLPCKIKKGNLKITIGTYYNGYIVKYNSVDLDLKAGVLYNFAEICDCKVRIFSSASDRNPQELIATHGKAITLPECNKAASAGMVWGYATSADGLVEYVPGSTIVPDGDMDLYLVQSKGTSGEALLIHQENSKQNPWDSEVKITWDKPLDLGEDYIIELVVSTDNECGLQFDLQSSEYGYCDYFGTDKCDFHNSWQESYTEHSTVSAYGIATQKEPSTKKVKLRTQTSACDGHIYTNYNQLKIGYGTLKGDLMISDFKIYKASDGPTGDVIDLLDGTAKFSDGSIVNVVSVDPVYDYTPAQEMNCIKLDVPKKLSQTWESQFWVKSDKDHLFYQYDRFKFSCYVKASKDLTFGSGIHGPADGESWSSGSPITIKASTEWSYYEYEGVFDRDCHERYGETFPYNSFAFDLSQSDDVVVYFANISLLINGDEVVKNGDFKTNDFSSFQWKRYWVFDTPLTVEKQSVSTKFLVGGGYNTVGKEIGKPEKPVSIPTKSQSADSQLEQFVRGNDIN